MLIHKKGRLVLSILGIAFSVVIMFMEIGFFNGINDSQAKLPTLLKADLVLIDRNHYSLFELFGFPRIRLQQALAFEEVVEAIPLYDGIAPVLNEQTGRLRGIYVLAFPHDSDPLLTLGVEENRDLLKIKGNVLYDRLSRDIYGDLGVGSNIIINGRPNKVIGTVEIGPNLTQDGFIIMGDISWERDKDRVNMGLLRVREGTEMKALKEKLLKNLPEDILIMTPEELRKIEVRYITDHTPTGSVFGVGVIIGFLIGVIICYQILFNEITDNMPQYATMKAMGFSKSFLVKLVLKQALLLSILGFIPGLIGGYLLYFGIQHYTKILMFMTVPRVALIFLLTVFMCVFAGLLAARKVLKADPAELY